MKNQTFGIEIEMAAIRRRDAARVIAAHFGTTARHTGGVYDAWVIPDGTGREWKVVKDSSIADTKPRQTEVVSPICRWEDIETVQALVRDLRDAGAKPNTTCGIHVHVGAGEHTPKTLRNLVNLVAAREGLLTDALGIRQRRLDHWCQPVSQDFLWALNDLKPKTMEDFARVWYNDDDWEKHAVAHYDGTRYHLLNLHSVFQKGTIEFRAFNSTLHAGKVKAYIQLCLAISNQALTVSAASPKPPVTDNPKYTFRCWLLRMGMIGDEFKTARQQLLARLEGNSAWRSGDHA